MQQIRAAGLSGCHWTVESDAHRALGVDSVEWGFTNVTVEGWGTVVPDGNLFSGISGFAALDDEFWTFVTLELVRQEPALAEAAGQSNRVRATSTRTSPLCVRRSRQIRPRRLARAIFWAIEEASVGCAAPPRALAMGAKLGAIRGGLL